MSVALLAKSWPWNWISKRLTFLYFCFIFCIFISFKKSHILNIYIFTFFFFLYCEILSMKLKPKETQIFYLFIFCEFLYLLKFYFLPSYIFILQNLGHEIEAQRDSHFIFRASDFLLTFNLPTFRRRAIGPSIYFSQIFSIFPYLKLFSTFLYMYIHKYTVYFFPLNFQSSHFWSDEGNWPINLFLSK